LVSHFHRPVLTSLFRKAWLELGTYALCRRTSYPLASNFPLIASVAGSRFTPAAPPTPSSFYVLRRLLRTKEKYITAKAASNTPPTIKIKVVTIAQFSSAGPYNVRRSSYQHERRLALHEVALRNRASSALQWPRGRWCVLPTGYYLVKGKCFRICCSSIMVLPPA